MCGEAIVPRSNLAIIMVRECDLEDMREVKLVENAEGHRLAALEPEVLGERPEGMQFNEFSSGVLGSWGLVFEVDSSQVWRVMEEVEEIVFRLLCDLGITRAEDEFYEIGVLNGGLNGREPFICREI